MKLPSRTGDEGAADRTTSGLAGALQERRQRPGTRADRTTRTPAAAERPRRTTTQPAADAMATVTPLADHRGEPDRLDDLRSQVRQAVVTDFGPALSEADVDEGRIRTSIAKQLEKVLRTSTISVSPAEREEFIDATLADMLGWGALTPLMADPDVTEVMCNGPHTVYVERAGKISMSPVRFRSDAALRQVADRMLAVAGRRVDEASPMADGRLHDGSRINVIIPPLSTGGTILTVRRFPERSMTVADLISKESLSTDSAVFLEAAVRGKLNVLVSGGTSTGKTTLLNVLSAFIPDGERIITIEDAAELRLGQQHVVGLESRPANTEGAGRVTIRDLVRNALRMRPDRIVVGEVRGGEAIDMLQAMNTGHEGSLTTVHANSPRDALLRLETMVLMSGVDLPLRAIREQIASAIDLIVQLGRNPDGTRAITHITEVQGREGDTITLQEIFDRAGSGPLRATGLRPRSTDRLAERSVDLPLSIFRRTAATSSPAAPARKGARR
ncbi:MAG TPA: CpaF family protein [Mycobacteriales bacterium]|nr:CpaF family protein [Mycobacteriales bacterium]HVX70105.1 CpaF family protein [Mycobacteriales bacterium]